MPGLAGCLAVRGDVLWGLLAARRIARRRNERSEVAYTLDGDLAHEGPFEDLEIRVGMPSKHPHNTAHGAFSMSLPMRVTGSEQFSGKT